MLDAGLWIVDSRYLILLDTRHLNLDAGILMLDV